LSPGQLKTSLGVIALVAETVKVVSTRSVGITKA